MLEPKREQPAKPIYYENITINHSFAEKHENIALI